MLPYLLELASELRAPSPPSLAPIRGTEAPVNTGDQNPLGTA